MTRLLAVSHTPLVSGAERVLERVLVAAVGEGWTVACCVPQGPLAQRLATIGVDVHPLPPLTPGAMPLPAAAVGLGWRSAAAGRVLRRAAAGADVVLVNGLLALPAVRAARLCVPVVWLVHDVVQRPLWKAVVLAARPAVTLAVGVSGAAARPVRALGMPAVVIPQGTAWPVPPARPAGSAPVLGCAGLLTPWKGQDVLLEAVAGLSRTDVVLELVGGTFPKDAAYEARLRTRAARPDLAGRVRFVGPVDDLLERMRDWTLLVSPSVDPETGPLVAFEAMSVGLPVVATAHGGPLEFIGEAGLLVPPRDVEALRVTIDRLLDDAPERRRMAEAGRRQVAQRLVLSERVAEVLGVLQDTAHGRVRQALRAEGPDVRIGIVSYNTAGLLDRCLSALPAALGDLRAEVVVVDNASRDGSADVADAHPGVRVERSPDNLGYARGMNAALAGTTAPVLLALNPDTVALPGSLARLVQTLTEHPRAGCVVPVLRNDDDSLQHSVHRFPGVVTALVMGLVPGPLRRGLVGRRWWLEGFAPHDRQQSVDWAIGAVHCLRAEALAGQLPYSQRWFMYAEDMELCWRLGRAGWTTVLEPRAEVAHVGNAAGAVEFGADREARWLDATYDWYVEAKGPLAARFWAAANVVGLSAKLVLLRAGGAEGHGRQLHALRAFHAGRVRRPSGGGQSRVVPPGVPPAEVGERGQDHVGP